MNTARANEALGDVENMIQLLMFYWILRNGIFDGWNSSSWERRYYLCYLWQHADIGTLWMALGIKQQHSYLATSLTCACFAIFWYFQLFPKIKHNKNYEKNKAAHLPPLTTSLSPGSLAVEPQDPAAPNSKNGPKNPLPSTAPSSTLPSETFPSQSSPVVRSSADVRRITQGYSRSALLPSPRPSFWRSRVLLLWRNCRRWRMRLRLRALVFWWGTTRWVWVPRYLVQWNFGLKAFFSLKGNGSKHTINSLLTPWFLLP